MRFTDVSTWPPALLTTTLSVVVALLSALLTVYFSNRAALRRQVLQFNHELALKKQERDLALRKDIYLSAAEAFQEGFVVFGKMVNLDLPLTEVTKDFTEKGSVILKIQIVGREATIDTVLEAWSSLSVAIIKLTSLRIPLDIARGKLNSLKFQAANYHGERDRWLEQMKQFNLQSTHDDRLWNILKMNFDFADKNNSEIIKEITQAEHELFGEQQKFMVKCLAEYRAVADLLVPALLAVRDELGIPGDELAVRASMNRVHSKMQNAVRDFDNSVRAAVTRS